MSLSELQPHQQRVVQEASNIKVNLDKLMAFGETDTFAALDEQEQQLLTEQSELMAELYEVLQMRIAGFKGFRLYTCHKQVLAKPMSRAEYNALRGWTVSSDENGDDEGFLVEYIDGGQPNHPAFNGYISWSPKDVFGRGYSENTFD